MRLLRCVVLWGLVLGVIATPARIQASPLTQEAGIARVRFVNTLSDPNDLNAIYPLNVDLDGWSWVTAVQGVAGYLDVPTGERTFAFQPLSGFEQRASVKVTLHDGDRVTIAAMNTIESLEAYAFLDDVSAPPRGTARVKIINATRDAGPVTVKIDQTDLVRDLAYGDASPHDVIMSGDHGVEIFKPGGGLLLGPVSQTFVSDRAYTLFLTGTADHFAVRFFDSSVLNPEPDTLLGFANMAQGIGPLDVYINDDFTPLYPAVRFSSVTTAYVTGQGPHWIEIYPAGADPAAGSPLAAGTATLGGHQHTLFVAYGSAGALKILTYTSDLSALPPNAARLHVIHAAAGDPAIQVETLDGIELFPRVITEGDAVRVVPAGTYNLRFRATTDGGPLMEKSGFVVPAGTVTLLIAVDDDPRTPLMNAVSTTLGPVPVQAAVRWANFTPGQPALDVYLDGEPVFTGLDYQQVSAYRLVEFQSYTLTVYPAGSIPSAALPLAETRLNLSTADAPRTAYLLGSHVMLVADRADLLPPGRAGVRFVHAAADTAAARVVDDLSGATLVDVLPFGDASVNLNIEPGTHDFGFVIGDATFGSELVLQAGSVYTVILAGDASARQVVAVIDTP